MNKGESKLIQMSRILIALSIVVATSVLAEPTSTIYINGEFYTANQRAPWASAVVQSEGKIIYVGDDKSAIALADTDSMIYDLRGRLVLPGLIDAHTHPGAVALTTGLLQMDVVQDKEILMKNIAQLVASNPDRKVLMGGYWDNGVFGETGPHKKDLDQIESERPVILYDYWAHSVWANSRALEMAGVDKNTPDIVPGLAFYQRDQNGEPSGWVTESAASVFVNNFHSVTPEVEKQLLAFLTYLRSQGVTTLFDAGNFGMDEDIYAALSRFDKQGQLPLRYHASYTLFLPAEYNTAIDSVKRLNKLYGSDRLRIDTLKIFHDGVIETRTADMFDDYLDTPGNSGDSLFSEQQLHDIIVQLDHEGINLHVHSVGDKSTNKLLNAVEQARKTMQRAQKITIAICHLETVLDTDFYRFKDLEVIASFTPHWHGGVGDANVVAALGAKAGWQMRAQPVISDDAVVTFSSDITSIYEWQSNSANPYVGMQIGHNRQLLEGGPNAPYALPRSERLRLDSLVDGYTIHAAYQLGRSEHIGSIEVGKQADLVILDRNLFEVNRYDVHKTKPTAVVMDGQLVHGQLP
ncbi:MAG: amidohydrolase [Gammaproteobacteria bacterium]|nr:amidohydrolase [Gammaproteobacteria bacterium]